MGTYWTNFAKYGNPNPIGSLQWPAFNQNKPSVMHFSQKAYIGEVPSLESLKVLDTYFNWRRSLEGSIWAK